jgi:predicted metal-dependent phosphoesterase TrpH
VIDLHLHTTASDGRSTPEALVTEVSHAGCHTIAVTDHDTTAGLAAARRAAEAAGLTFFDGIEMTAVDDGRDVHILGYFFDPVHPELATFLSAQRARRRERLIAMADQLARAGAPVEVETVLALSPPGKSLGRPALAQALVAAGFVRDVAEAFDRYLAEGRPGYASRDGASPALIVEQIRGAGGIASMAHPGKLRKDEIIGPMVDAGLAAIEVFHPDHAPEDRARYQQIAARFGLLTTGGSDYHGPGSGRSDGLGVVSLPGDALAAVLAHVERLRHG